jgi:hypothetical protein
MGTFIVVVIIIGIVAGFMSRTSPTVEPNAFIKSQSQKKSKKFSIEHYNSIPSEIRLMIENNKSFELAEILVKIEMDGHKQNLDMLIKGINYGNPSLMPQIERIRQDLRNRNYLK